MIIVPSFKVEHLLNWTCILHIFFQILFKYIGERLAESGASPFNFPVGLGIAAATAAAIIIFAVGLRTGWHNCWVSRAWALVLSMGTAPYCSEDERLLTYRLFLCNFTFKI